MQTDENKIKKHNTELKKVLKKIKITGFSFIGNTFYFHGTIIDLSATKAEPGAIAYTTLKRLFN